MSIAHLQELREELVGSQWRIVEAQAGDDYAISAVWKNERPLETRVLHLEFEGLDASAVLPIEKAYGCHVREFPQCSLYFARINRSWQRELAAFMETLNRIVS